MGERGVGMGGTDQILDCLGRGGSRGQVALLRPPDKAEEGKRGGPLVRRYTSDNTAMEGSMRGGGEGSYLLAFRVAGHGVWWGGGEGVKGGEEMAGLGERGNKGGHWGLLFVGEREGRAGRGVGRGGQEDVAAPVLCPNKQILTCLAATIEHSCT